MDGGEVKALEPRATKCTCCEHPISAQSPEALARAMVDHADYINATADRATDSHFEDARRDALIYG